MITKEEFLKQENENEVWGLIENFFNYWKGELMMQGFKEDELNQIPTDKESYEIVIQMIKNNN